MTALPGKKLLFMGAELGQEREWNHDQDLDWHLVDDPGHLGIQRLVRDLNRLYTAEPSLHELDCEPAGFEWVDCHDADRSVVSFLRRGRSTDDLFMAVCNFTPVPQPNYRVGAPRGGVWIERLNSDAEAYGGAGWGNLGEVEAAPIPAHGRPYSLTLVLPPLGIVLLKSEGPTASASGDREAAEPASNVGLPAAQGEPAPETSTE
jgi:1,4-alpha-glucan branching enzyme